jgi:3-deoxy-7-phosphoheptulonate synthase
MEITRILEGKDARLLLIVGPCSIHDSESAKEYAVKLKELSHEVSDQFFLVMRTYFEKPRSILGWKGFLNDPDLNNTNDIARGLELTRKLLVELLQLKVPMAAEFLEPTSCAYFDDLISWGCIGARTSTSQIHRQMASGLPMPVAFKNTTEGNIEAAIHGIVSCAQTHAYIGINQNGLATILNTTGNSHGHLVLRGSDSETNYDPESISHALHSLKKACLPSRVLIDCSHGNSRRRYEQQYHVFQSVMSQIMEGNHAIRGMLLESHLYAGNQQITHDSTSLKYAVSITDPCLDWSTTENLIQWAYQKVKNEHTLKNHSQILTNASPFVFQNI